MINNESSFISYSGNNSTKTEYPIPFPFRASADISVIVTDSGGTVTNLSTSAFTVRTSPDDEGRITGGSVTTATAYPDTSTILIRRNTPQLQNNDFVEGGRISPEALETALDILTMQAQETRRDATGDNVAGIVAEGRTISPGSGSGLSVTNGDGAAGNPTINHDSSSLSTVTTPPASGKVRVETSAGALQLMTIDNFLGSLYPAYRQIELPVSHWTLSGGATDISLETGYVNFQDTASGAIAARFVLPRDYAGGEVTCRAHNELFGGTNGDTFTIRPLVYNAQGKPPYSMLVSGNTEFVETFSDTDSESSSMSLGSGFVAGNHYQILFERRSGHASDTTSFDMRFRHLTIEYRAGRVTTASA